MAMTGPGGSWVSVAAAPTGREDRSPSPLNCTDNHAMAPSRCGAIILAGSRSSKSLELRLGVAEVEILHTREASGHVREHRVDPSEPDGLFPAGAVRQRRALEQDET